MQKLTRNIIVNAAFALCLALFCAIGWLSYYSTLQVEASEQREGRTYKVYRNFNFLLIALLDAETGQRGFIITGTGRRSRPGSRTG